MKKVNILGVGISKTTKKEAIETVEKWLSTARVIARPASGRAAAIFSRFIVTPNPEMLVLAQKDKEFKEILNKADLAIPDGIGLVLISRLLNKGKNQKSKVKNTSKKSKIFSVISASSSVIPAPFGLELMAERKAGIYTNNQVLTERVSGTDLMLDLCELAAQKGYTVGLLGAKGGVAKKTAQVLKEKFSGLKVEFAVSEMSELSLRGVPSLSRDDEAISKTKEMRLPRSAAYSVLARNDNFDCDLLFVAFGAPKQEKLISLLIKPQGSCCACGRPLGLKFKFKVAMGVGGSFDFISGKIKRAPKLMQNLGLEWLWRLVQEPKRIKRIWTATVIFSWLVLKDHLKKARKV